MVTRIVIDLVLRTDDRCDALDRRDEVIEVLRANGFALSATYNGTRVFMVERDEEKIMNDGVVPDESAL